ALHSRHLHSFPTRRSSDLPRKLEVLPYVVSSGKFLQHHPGDPFNEGHTLGQNIGSDLKVGIGSNLTLNATINPDFGQVEVDPARSEEHTSELQSRGHLVCR